MSGSKKKTFVTLVVGDTKKDFELKHAERLLGMANNGGWKLPEKSAFEFSKKDGVKRRGNKRQA